MSGGALRLVLGDQLSDGLTSLHGIDPERDTVLMAEVRSECTYVRHHKKKIVLVLSAMRHFAARLRDRGITVRYVPLNAVENTHTIGGEVARAVAVLRPDRVIATHPGEWRLLREMDDWENRCGARVEVLDDTRFLCGIRQFRHWVGERPMPRMEFFYREMRRIHGLLMDGDAPVAGRWNFDRENRQRMPVGVSPPPAPRFEPDTVTSEVMALVAEWFGDHFGDVDGFNLPVTAEEAELALEHFISDRLPDFGDWQDFMRDGDPVLFHALVSTSLNVGLLNPLMVCRIAERAFRQGVAPVNAVEGFIRQVLGWREYVRGMYWLRMPGYAAENVLEASRPLPWFFWSGRTRMHCVAAVVRDTRDNAYAHHIQRLMVTGNFALLAAINPAAVDEWYMVVYADAFEWVEMPNVRGMALFADGGAMGSKPYAASGAYINRMSDYCRHCTYRPTATLGDRACPFNVLYWDFMARHRDRFRNNARLAMPLRTLHRMDPQRIAAIREAAARFLAAMDASELV